MPTSEEKYLERAMAAHLSYALTILHNHLLYSCLLKSKIIITCTALINQILIENHHV